jgi:hypothetical protein
MREYNRNHLKSLKHTKNMRRCMECNKRIDLKYPEYVIRCINCYKRKSSSNN